MEKKKKLEMVREIIKHHYRMRQLPEEDDFRVLRMLSRVDQSYIEEQYQKTIEAK